MQIPLQVKAGEIPLTDEIHEYIRERVGKLETLFNGIVSARVVLDAPLGHHRKGGPFEVSIDLAVPGAVLVVSRHAAANLHAAIREAFQALTRQLEEYVHRVR